MNINEANAMTGSKYIPDVSFDFGGPDDTFEREYNGFSGEDMIGDSETDMKHGTFEDDDDEVSYELDFDIEDNEPSYEDVDVYGFDDEVDSEVLEPLQEQVNKTLDMFKRFKNY